MLARESYAFYYYNYLGVFVKYLNKVTLKYLKKVFSKEYMGIDIVGNFNKSNKHCCDFLGIFKKCLNKVILDKYVGIKGYLKTEMLDIRSLPYTLLFKFVDEVASPKLYTLFITKNNQNPIKQKFFYARNFYYFLTGYNTTYKTNFVFFIHSSIYLALCTNFYMNYSIKSYYIKVNKAFKFFDNKFLYFCNKFPLSNNLSCKKILDFDYIVLGSSLYMLLAFTKLSIIIRNRNIKERQSLLHS